MSMPRSGSRGFWRRWEDKGTFVKVGLRASGNMPNILMGWLLVA